MGKFTIDASLDAALSYTKDNANAVHVCATQPTSRADAITKSLATVAVSTTDFTLANGTSGRKYTFGGKSAVSISADGSADHVAFISATELLDVTTATAQTLTTGGTVDIGSFDRQIDDPV